MEHYEKESQKGNQDRDKERQRADVIEQELATAHKQLKEKQLLSEVINQLNPNSITFHWNFIQIQKRKRCEASESVAAELQASLVQHKKQMEQLQQQCGQQQQQLQQQQQQLQQQHQQIAQLQQQLQKVGEHGAKNEAAVNEIGRMRKDLERAQQVNKSLIIHKNP